MNVNGIGNFRSVNFSGNENNKVGEKPIFEMQNDSYDFNSTQKKASEKTTEQKQEIMQKARTKAAGWSVLFGFLDTLYYGLRSDKKVAKQFDLDAEKDKAFIKNIKKQQMLCTLPSLIPGVGIIPSVVCWLYNKNMDSSKIKV